MRFLASLLLLVATAAFGGSPDATTNASPTGLGRAEVTWPALANGWPETLWVYKVVPQEFPPAVVSNLLAIGSFTAKDKTPSPPDIRERDKKATCFSSPDASKRLAICPSLGFLDYRDGKAEAPNQLTPVVGVPNEQEATRLGLKYLRLVGVDVSQLATKPSTCDLDLHWEVGVLRFTDEKTGAEVARTNLYGVRFTRRIDGVDAWGMGTCGGAIIRFGNNAKVASLQVCWRNLKPIELHQCPSPQQITEWLRKGQITLGHYAGGAPLGSLPGRIKKLIITKAALFYDAHFQGDPMDWVAPFARFEAIAEVGQATTPVWFQCPLTLPISGEGSRPAPTRW